MKPHNQGNRPSSWLPFDSPKFGVGKKGSFKFTSLKICIQIFVANLVIFFLNLAIYNFDGNGKYRLPLVLGETVKVVEECEGSCDGIS